MNQECPIQYIQKDKEQYFTLFENKMNIGSGIEFSILKIFICHYNQYIPTPKLIQLIHEDMKKDGYYRKRKKPYVDHTCKIQMSRIRNEIERLGGNKKWITHEMPGGYRFYAF